MDISSNDFSLISGKAQQFTIEIDIACGHNIRVL
jgi:hypothetical protein